MQKPKSWFPGISDQWSGVRTGRDTLYCSHSHRPLWVWVRLLGLGPFSLCRKSLGRLVAISTDSSQWKLQLTSQAPAAVAGEVTPTVEIRRLRPASVWPNSRQNLQIFTCDFSTDSQAGAQYYKIQCTFLALSGYRCPCLLLKSSRHEYLAPSLTPDWHATTRKKHAEATRNLRLADRLQVKLGQKVGQMTNPNILSYLADAASGPGTGTCDPTVPDQVSEKSVITSRNHQTAALTLPGHFPLITRYYVLWTIAVLSHTIQYFQWMTI